MAQQHHQMFPSGILRIDNLLGGGFEVGLSYLLYGSPQCTTMLQQSIANAICQIAPHQRVAVIDGNNGIRPYNILSILQAKSPPTPPAILLNRLHIARAFTTDQLLSLLDNAPDIIQELNAPILFVNGLLHLVQEEEEGTPSAPIDRGTPPDPRIFRRAQLAAQLKQLAFTQKIAVIVSADAPKRLSQPPLRIGQTTRHRFHVLIRHTQQTPVDTFILEKHPNRPWMQRSTITRKKSPQLSSRQTTLFEDNTPLI